MYFSNMLGMSGVKTYTRSPKTKIPFVNTVGDTVSEGFVTAEDGKIFITSDTSKKNIFCTEFEGECEGMYLDEKSGLSYKHVADTAENPLIVVLAKGVKFYEGVKTLVKFVNISNDVVLMCLMFGACEFEFPDGTFVPMQRCNDQFLDNRNKRYYTGRDLLSVSKPIEKESGYDMSYDVVNCVLVNIKNDSAVSYRTAKNLLYVFDTENVNIHKEKAIARKKAEEERKRLKAEAKAKAEAMAKEEAERKKKEECEKQFKEASNGAAAFMEYVKSITQG